MQKPREITPYHELPEDAPMLYCFGCNYMAQPEEMTPKHEGRCPHCAQKLEETTKGAIIEDRLRKFAPHLVGGTKKAKKTPTK